MKKILALLLLVSAVVGMTMPAMASITIGTEIENEQDASNWASSAIAQSQENEGDQVNINAQIAVGGDAQAESEANANAEAEDESSHNVGGEDSDDNIGGLDNSGASNDDSGNAVAVADADGGDATTNGDNEQENSLDQTAIAVISTEQENEQDIEQDVDLDIEDIEEED